MSATKLPCYLVTKDADKRATAAVSEIALDELPEGDVTIRVAFSSLNYKDALAATGQPGVARKFPHVPGIDAAGTVVASSDSRFREGDEVLVTGFELGAGSWGGYSGCIRVPAGWVVPLPRGLNLRESMIYGTAGFTAALAVEALLENRIHPGSGPIVVTGATGGVGSVGVALLAKAGYDVAAVTGKADAHDYLKQLGAGTILARHELDDESGKPLSAARWAGAIDTVGGRMLANIIRATQRAGCVTASGLVGGTELPLTVFPFILRGVRLVGIDSAEYPIERRAAIWQKLAGEWRPANLELLVADTVTLAGLSARVQDILAGKIRGRVLVRPTVE